MRQGLSPAMGRERWLRERGQGFDIHIDGECLDGCSW